MNLSIMMLCLLIGSCQQLSQGNTYGITDRYINIEGNTPGAENCYKTPDCDASSKYRTADGSCNNLDHPTWGSTLTTYMRLLPAHYSDGLHEIRKASNGSVLPNVRLVSRTLLPDVYVPDKANSLALMQWGQVLTHDSASTGFPVILNCCPNGQFADPPVAECYPIQVPPGDQFYSRYNVTCMSYTRLETTKSALNCSLTPQQQFSYASQWLDLSLMYGSTVEDSNSVRVYIGGRLKTEIVNGEVTLPVSHERQDFCRISSSNQSCLNTGDVRVNQNPDIGVMTIVFTREHNRLAGKLATLNPSWNDEKLYQEARRINVAQAQHITFSEYLHHVLANEYINGLKLRSLKSGFTEYDAKTRGGTLSEFTGSIFRTFHSTVQGDLKLIGGGSGGCPMKSASLGDLWWTSGDLVLQCFQQLAKGLLAQQARVYSNYFTVQETEFFFKDSKPYGDDMESVDLMRGRDQGIPSYNQFRKVCGLSAFSSMQQLKSAMKPQVVDKLSKLYGNVEDIDLFIGALFENPISPGLTGPTAQCIMAQQFARWKFGDRFYYEHKHQTGSFSPGQLSAIKKVTFSSLMCRNTKIGRIQQNGFYQASYKNKIVSCAQIPSIDLRSWKE